MSRYYDSKNGETYLKPNNINGNYSFDASYRVLVRLNKSGSVTFSNNLTFGMVNSVDRAARYVGNFDKELPKNKVLDTRIQDNITFRLQTGCVSASLFADISANQYTRTSGLIGGLKQTDKFSAYTINYGATGLVNLPRNWSISTDLKLYTRRGYTDKRLNTTDLIWNARISKSIMKGALVFLLDGYDILHQLSNVSYTVNAQMRTETVSNVIPSYVLLHVQWRFNRQPKR